MALLYKVLLVALTCRCWTLYRTEHFVYVLVHIGLRYLPAYVEKPPDYIWRRKL